MRSVRGYGESGTASYYAKRERRHPFGCVCSACFSARMNAESPRPKCPRCGAFLAHREDRRKQVGFYGCGNFPRCRFTASEEVIQEAIIRQIEKVNSGGRAAVTGRPSEASS